MFQFLCIFFSTPIGGSIQPLDMASDSILKLFETLRDGPSAAIETKRFAHCECEEVMFWLDFFWNAKKSVTWINQKEKWLKIQCEIRSCGQGCELVRSPLSRTKATRRFVNLWIILFFRFNDFAFDSIASKENSRSFSRTSNRSKLNDERWMEQCELETRFSHRKTIESSGRETLAFAQIIFITIPLNFVRNDERRWKHTTNYINIGKYFLATESGFEASRFWYLYHSLPSLCRACLRSRFQCSEICIHGGVWCVCLSSVCTDHDIMSFGV